MIYQCRQPSLHLREYVKDYLLICFDFTQAQTIPVKPYPACPKQGIIFYIKGSVIASNSITGICEKRTKTVIFGQPLARQNLYLPKDYLAISVRFQPGALFKFLGIPMTEFLQKNEDAELVFGQEISLLHDQLTHSTSYEQLLGLIEEFLWKKIRQLKANIHPIDKIGRLLVENPQAFTLDKIAEQACLSASQLERRFLQQIGVPPKYFVRICRFYKAYLHKQRNANVPWLDIAWENGYTDYQHMVKDFKEFAQCTPNQLMGENLTAPEQYLALNPNFTYD